MRKRIFDSFYVGTSEVFGNAISENHGIVVKDRLYTNFEINHPSIFPSTFNPAGYEIFNAKNDLVNDLLCLNGRNGNF